MITSKLLFALATILNLIIHPRSDGALIISSSGDILIVSTTSAPGSDSVTEMVSEPEVHRVGLGLQQFLAGPIL